MWEKMRLSIESPNSGVLGFFVKLFVVVLFCLKISAGSHRCQTQLLRILVQVSFPFILCETDACGD